MNATGKDNKFSHREHRGCRDINIVDIIAEWFDDAEKKLAEKLSPDNNIDKLVAASMSVVENYVTSCHDLLSGDRKLPTMALLRVLGELVAKVSWLLTKDEEQAIEEKLNAWSKHSLNKNRKYYEQIKTSYGGKDGQQEIENRLSETNKALNSIRTTITFPKIDGLFSEAFGDAKTVFHPGMYLRFLSAVHLDPLTLYNTLDGDTYEGDVKYSIDDLRIDCLIIMRYFLEAIYTYYGLDDFEKICTKCNNVIEAYNAKEIEQK